MNNRQKAILKEIVIFSREIEKKKADVEHLREVRFQYIGDGLIYQTLLGKSIELQCEIRRDVHRLAKMYLAYDQARYHINRAERRNTILSDMGVAI